MTNGKINLHIEEPYLEAEQLSELIRLWILDVDRRCTSLTTDGYACKVVYFVRWWQEVGPSREFRLREVDLQAFERWLRSQKGRHNKPLMYHTRKDILRRLREALRWGWRKGYVNNDYSAWVPAADGEPPARKAASIEQLAQLFRAASETHFPQRDRAILAVLIGTGIRRGECVSLRVENIEFLADGSGYALITGKRTRANKSGIRRIAFDAATGSYLQTYIDFLGLSSGPLWLGAQGPLKVVGIYKVVKQCLAKAGLSSQFQGCHDLRRTFATLLARQAQSDVDSDRLRRQMGHTTYRMTSEYTLLDVEDVRESLHSPMSHISSGA